MATLQIHGTPEPRPAPSELASGLPAGSVQVRHSARLETARAEVPPLLLEGLPDDVVEIELEDGLHIWSRLEDVRRDLAPRSERDAVSEIVTLPTEIAIGPASRAAAGWAIKALKLVNIDLAGDIAHLASQYVEGRLQPGPGLYQCSNDDVTRLLPVGPVPANGPALVFLHGTASSTQGSFAGLWSPPGASAITKLFKLYEGRVFAYQHLTLTKSPVENAIALVKQLRAVLGDGAELHLVSHSRGGLIGELLARGMRPGAAPITRDDLDIFPPGREKDRDDLQQLSSELQAARLRITRFVRVACPARGTTLADGRLDRYLSVLVNLGALVGLKGSPVYDGLTSLLAAVLKKRTDPRELPGLEAQMPTSPLVRMLNRADVATEADLHVLGGDLAGVGLLGRLKTLATDLYYRDDHDLVVNTPAMLGGVQRSKPVPYWIDTGDQVNHFHYFARTDTSNRLVAALSGSDTDYRTLRVQQAVVTSADYVKRGLSARPVVFVLPGIMGSQLTVGKVPVWMNIRQLAVGGLSLLNLSGSGAVAVSGLIASGYGELCDHLTATHDVIPFAYDWRQSLDKSAALLRDEIEKILPVAEASKQPIRLLAHSMGGLVVRMMLSTSDGRATWDRMCSHPGARFVMLGTPNAGSHAIAALLMGRDALVKKLALVDIRSTHAELLQTIAGFDGVLDLLPQTAQGTLDLFDAGVWTRLLDRDAPAARGLFGSSVATSQSAGFRWSVPAAGALASARSRAERMSQNPLDPARVTYVAGVADETACDVIVDENAPEGRRVRIMASANGDGRVLWSTGIPKNVRTFYMDAVHGDLASDRRHFAAIVDLLDTGTTTRLPITPPARRDAADRFEMREHIPAMVPDEAELISDALGGHRRTREKKPSDARITIRVLHDNLTNARAPVLVSHYKQDVIVAAEAYLDKRLDGRLTELHRMELYPGPLNTGVVVLNDTTHDDLATHPGAIVAGLGFVGELTPGSLMSTLAHALTLYGSDCVGRERRRQQRELGEAASSGIVAAPVAAVLVGSGDGGLSLADSIKALLSAIKQANHRLRGGAGDDEDGAPARLIAQITSVDVIELYEDRAIEGLHVLRQLAASPEYADYSVQRLLTRGDGGIRRIRFDQASSWWQRISVKSDEKGGLQFEAVTRVARASARLLPLQRGQVDGFVREAKGTTSYDPRLGRTLFEMLVPNDFKPYAPDQQKLALMLTKETAALPWELLQDGFNRSGEPLSVASGMLRQLLLPDERAQVLRSPANTALVIGNPIVSDPRFPKLAGAADEATTVAGVLSDSGKWDVTMLLEEAATPAAVLTAMYERPWRILHLAAHGVFEFDRKDGSDPVSGLVLDNGLFFTSADADQMRYVPELVFINCCHLGNTADDPSASIPFHRLAANLATQFIKMGARAVIAAGWAVDDAAAKTFATSFYQRLLGGVSYGDAMLQARRDTYTRHGQTNTWGAYQCYGDPSFSIVAGEQQSRSDEFVSASELRLWLEAAATRARERDGDVAALLAELRQQVQAPPEWFEQSDLCAAAAQAFFELADFESALQYFSRVVDAEEANAPIRALEQCANCKARLAMTLASSDRPRAEALLAQAEKELRSLLTIGETSERLALLGSVFKRQAMVANGDNRLRALGNMIDAYRKGYARSKSNGAGDPYPLSNQIAGAIVLSWHSGNGESLDHAEVAALLEELEKLAAGRRRERTDPFNLSGRADCLFLNAIASRTLDDDARQAIRQQLLAALSRGASARVRQSMRSQFDFFDRFVDALPEQERLRMLDDLKKLREVLIT